MKRTYWHLADLGRRPTDYEVASSRLLYYTERGLETRPPLAEWFRRYQLESPLQCSDWERFADPRATTYATYTQLQCTQEAFVAGALRVAEVTHHDRKLAPAWLSTLDRLVPVLRYPVHGLEMLAAYVGHLAPSGRIVIAAALQAADELRRIQWLAYRMRQLRDTVPEFGSTARDAWQVDPIWQPLRELIERMLVTYDWGEALIALELALKPRFDELFVVELASIARQHGDELFATMLFSLGEDARWHREWSRELVKVALADRPANRDVIAGWLAHWTPLVRRAIAAFAPVLGDAASRAAALEVE